MARMARVSTAVSEMSFYMVNLFKSDRIISHFAKHLLRKCEPQERNPCASNLRDSKGLANIFYKLETKDKATFYFPTEAWVMLAPSSKKPQERESAVDSGASNWKPFENPGTSQR